MVRSFQCKLQRVRMNAQPPPCNVKMEEFENFDFLWREPGAGPTGRPARHVELPFSLALKWFVALVLKCEMTGS
jgi:hypothetical protein